MIRICWRYLGKLTTIRFAQCPGHFEHIGMSDQQFGFIKTDKKFIKLHYNDIILIKGMGNYVEIMTEGGKKYTYYKSLKELIESLPNEFMRVHNSFIVNVTHISSLEDNHLILPNTKVSVGKSYRTCLAEALSKRML